METLIQIKRMKLDIGGQKHIVYVGNDMTEEKMSRILQVTRAYLQQYVYVEAVMAETFMVVIEESIVRKKCFKFNLKKYWKDCLASLRKTISEYDSYSNSDFNNDFAMTYYSKISPTIYTLRDKMAKRLQNVGVTEKAGLYANAILLYNFLAMCISTYEAIQLRLKEKLSVDLAKAFISFLPIRAFESSYQFLREMMGKDYDWVSNHLNNKELKACFERVRDGIFDSKIQDEAVVTATEELDEETQKIHRRYYDVKEVLDGNFPKIGEKYKGHE